MTIVETIDRLAATVLRRPRLSWAGLAVLGGLAATNSVSAIAIAAATGGVAAICVRTTDLHRRARDSAREAQAAAEAVRDATIEDRDEQVETARRDMLSSLSVRLLEPFDRLTVRQRHMLSRVDYAGNMGLRDEARALIENTESVRGTLSQMIAIATERTGLSPHLEPVTVRKMLSDLRAQWEPQFNMRGMEYELHIEPDVPEQLQMDGDGVRDCCDLILAHCLRKTVEGGVYLHVAMNTAGIIIYIADTGEGHDARRCHEVFLPLELHDDGVQATSRRKASAAKIDLGLPAAMAHARRMGGTIELTSKIGVGSEFRLDVPVLRMEGDELDDSIPIPLRAVTMRQEAKREQAAKLAASKDKAAQTAPASETDESPRVADAEPAPIAELDMAAIELTTGPDRRKAGAFRIGSADDLPLNLKLIEMYGPDLDAEVCSYLTAEDLLAAHAEQAFDLIVMDLHMPGMGGLEGIAELRRRDVTVPILTLTADTSAATHADALSAGTDVFLAKPLVRREFLDAVGYCRELRRKAA